MIVPAPYIIDTTLRDGEQSPGVVFSPKEKLKIAELLNELGVNEVEAGTPAVGSDEKKAIRAIVKSGFSFRTSCWCRARFKDISDAAKLGTTSVNISLPVSDIQIETLGKSRPLILAEIRKIIPAAKNLFSHVTLGAQDATRADIHFLMECIFYAHESNVNRIRIADTAGVSDPLEIYELFNSLHKNFPDVEFEFHGHNDLGMATANAISALKAGIACVSATVNGLGERAGNSVLEEIIAYLNYKEKIRCFNTKTIYKLCQYVAKATGKNLPDNKPLVGAKSFMHESGIHVSSLIQNPKSYQALDPCDFGNLSLNFAYGKHSGKAAILHFFRHKNVFLSENDAQCILSRVKSLAAKKKSSVTPDELILLYLSECENQSITSDTR